MITASDIKQEFGAARLRALAVAEGLGSKQGRIQCPVPGCGEDDHRAATISDVDGAGLWHCHRCGTGGSAIDLIALRRGVSDEEAIAELRGSSVAMPAPEPKRPAPDGPKLWEALAAFAEDGLAYLESRGLADAVERDLVRFHVGACGWSWLDEKAAEGYRVAMPMRDSAGVVRSFQVRSINPATDRKRTKLSLLGASLAGLAFGDPLAAQTEPFVYVTEGMADTLALQLAGVTTIGVAGEQTVKTVDELLGDVERRTIVLCPQNDTHEKSQKSFETLGRKLRRARAHVAILRTPPQHKDPAEWWQADRAAMLAAVAAARNVPAFPPSASRMPPRESSAGSGAGSGAGPAPDAQSEPRMRTTIQIRPEEHEVNAEIVATLAHDPTLYQRSGSLVHVVRDLSARDGVNRIPGGPRIKGLHAAVLRARMTACAAFEKWAKQDKEWQAAHPPEWAVSAVHAAGEWSGVRALVGVIEAPVLRPDGTILQEAGYDAATALLFEPTAEFLPALERPTRPDAQAAAAELLDVVKDFPFELAEHKAAFLAALLTPFARHAFTGPAPMTHVDATTRASGKTLLVDAIAVVFTGRAIARTPNTTEDVEMAKKITSIALAADPLILLDNVKGSLGTAALDSALTSTTWADRLMSTNEKPTLPLMTVWFSTGNNTAFLGDIFRRILPIRLAPTDDHPEDRDNFTHKDLLGWIASERPRLVRAALTVLRAYAVADRPTAPLSAWGSFEGWSRLVRQAVYWATDLDPCGGRRELEASSDTDSTALADLVAGLEEMTPGAGGLTVREILARLDLDTERVRNERIEAAKIEKYQRLRAGLDAVAPQKGGRSYDSKAVGYQFRKFRGRWVGGRKLEQAGRTREDTIRWTVWPVKGATVETRETQVENAIAGSAPRGGGAGDAGYAGDATTNARENQTLWG